VTFNSTDIVTIKDGAEGTAPLEPGTYNVLITINNDDAWSETNPLGRG